MLVLCVFTTLYQSNRQTRKQTTIFAWGPELAKSKLPHACNYQSVFDFPNKGPTKIQHKPNKNPTKVPTKAKQKTNVNTFLRCSVIFVFVFVFVSRFALVFGFWFLFLFFCLRFCFNFLFLFLASCFCFFSTNPTNPTNQPTNPTNQCKSHGLMECVLLASAPGFAI